MSDFLTRLAARELGQAPLLMPRVRALYEPGGDGRSSGEPVGLAPEARAPEDTGDRRAPDSLARRSTERTFSFHAREPEAMPRPPSFPHTPGEVSRKDPSVPHEREPLRTDPYDPPHATARHREHTERVLIEAHESIPPRDSIPGVHSKVDVPRGGARDQALPSRRAVLLGRDRPQASAEPVVPSAAPERPAPTRLVHGHVRGRDEEPAVVNPRAGSRSLESRRPPSLPVAEAIEAPIHVTIGRIEVTAVTNAPRAGEKAKARPRVSLDDYLSGRRRGPR